MKSLAVLVATMLVTLYLAEMLSLTSVVALSEAIHRESVDDQVLPRNAKLIGLTSAPENGLARFFIFNSASRPYETRQATSISNGGNVFGYKRSSSALDALTGVTLGKRSAPNYEFVNMEPIYGRQYPLHIPIPRMYDIRWGPLDSYDASSGSD